MNNTNILNLNEDLSQSSQTDDFDELFLDQHFIKKEKIIRILSKPNNERTEEQISLIESYILNLSNINQKFSKDHIEDKDYKDIISLSANTSQYKTVNHINDLIYNINEEAHYFYIILKGQVKIYNLKKETKEMNAHQYYEKLLYYRNNRENYLLKKTIDDNFHNYPVEYNDMKIIDKIMIKLNLMKIEAENDNITEPDFLEYLVKYYGSSFLEFRLETYRDFIKRKNDTIIKYNKIALEQNKKDKVKKILQYDIYEARLHDIKNRNILKEQLNYISPEICRKYYFFMNKTNELTNYYELILDHERNVHNYFGDFINNKYTQRAISNSENLELLKFSNEYYKDFIKREKAKIIDSQVSFLLNNFFFDKIPKEHFIRYYYSLFETVNYSLNQLIISQNEKVEYIYFIKSGIVKLISNRSILENYILIELIKNINKKNENSESDKENILSIKNYEFKSDIQLMQKELNIKHKKHLITYQMNQGLGYECFYYGINYLYTAIAESKEVKLYRIKIKHLIEILKDKGDITFKHFVNKSKDKMRLLLERLILINNDLMKFYDDKFYYKKNLLEQKDIKEDKYKKDIKKFKNQNQEFKLVINAQDDENDKNKNLYKKNFIKNLFKKKLGKNKKLEEPQSKSPELFSMRKRRLSYNDFFAQKKIFPRISNKCISRLSPNKIEINNDTNFTTRKKTLKSIKSQYQLETQKYHFSEGININKNNELLNKTLSMNKKLLSNIFSSFPSYKKISNEEIKKKFIPKKMNTKSTLKNFKKLLLTQFSLNKYNNSYKYDFRRDLDNNLKMLKYSVFEYTRTPKINDNKLLLKLNIMNENKKK